MSVDTEVFLMKFSGYFHIYIVHVECLKDFCDFAEQEHKQILVYANILNIYPSLKSFLCQEHSAQRYWNNSLK
jgi:hypothetical protein